MSDVTNPDCKALICCGGEDFFENYSSAGPDEDLFFNEEVSYTSECPPFYNCEPSTVTIPANANRPASNNPPRAAEPPGPETCRGPFTGRTQAEANAKALACATRRAKALTVITGPIIFYSAETTVTCPTGFWGDDVVVPAGTFRSFRSQARANNQALAFANSQLVCCLVPAVWWRMEEASGDRPDSMGFFSGLDLTETQGSATGAAGKILDGAFMTSAGASQQLSSGSSTGLGYSGNGFTIAAWINYDGDASSAFQFGLTLRDSSFNIIGFLVYDGATSKLQINSPLQDITVTNPALAVGWNLVILSYHNLTETITVRTNNGIAVESAGTLAFPATNRSNFSALYFHPTGGTGAYDETGVFNYDLSQDCEEQLWNAGAGRAFGTLFPPPPCVDNPVSALVWTLTGDCATSSGAGGSVSMAVAGAVPPGSCSATTTLIGSCNEYTLSIEVVTWAVATTSFIDGPSGASLVSVVVDGNTEFSQSQGPVGPPGSCTGISGGGEIVTHLIPSGVGTHAIALTLQNGSLPNPPGPCTCTATFALTPLTPP